MAGKKLQVVYVHGGITFKNREDYLDFLRNRNVSIGEKIRWHGDWLQNALGNEFDVIKPIMPLEYNAVYED